MANGRGHHYSKNKQHAPRYHRSPFLSRLGVSDSPPSILLRFIFQSHFCPLCELLPTTHLRVLRHHYEAFPLHPCKVIRDPPDLPPLSTFSAISPIVYYANSLPISIVLKLQQLMTYGMSFQTPAPPNSNPFLTPFQSLLDLDLNAPPLTRNPLPVTHRHTLRVFSNHLAYFRKLITRHQLRIISTDHSSGLVILTDTELQVLYSTFLLQYRRVPPSWYYSITTNLRRKLFAYDQNLKASTTDDRPPTFYFKVKVHKTNFSSSATVHSNIFTFDPYAISPYVRPIANHSSSLSSLASVALRPLFSPIIASHPLLADNVNTAIAQLSIYGPPPAVYHYDIKQFYPSLPHSLALEAFLHYHPTKQTEYQLLESLLSNFLISGDIYHHLGTTGIPMGLPLAPEIARLVTAFQLDTRVDIQYPVTLSLYFDNLYTSHPPQMMNFAQPLPTTCANTHSPPFIPPSPAYGNQILPFHHSPALHLLQRP